MFDFYMGLPHLRSAFIFAFGFTRFCYLVQLRYVNVHLNSKVCLIDIWLLCLTLVQVSLPD